MALRALSDNLHLFSFLLSDDTILLAHFLKHYHGQVGCRPERTAVAIRTRDDEPRGALAATLGVLGMLLLLLAWMHDGCSCDARV